jgi:hypothetical protein
MVRFLKNRFQKMLRGKNSDSDFFLGLAALLFMLILTLLTFLPSVSGKRAKN